MNPCPRAGSGYRPAYGSPALPSWVVSGLPPVVAALGGVLVAAPPGGPAQPVPHVAAWPACRGGEKAGDLVTGQWDQPRRWRLGVLGQRSDGQKRQREHGQGDPPVPGRPAAHLMLVERGQALLAGASLPQRAQQPCHTVREAT